MMNMENEVQLNNFILWCKNWYQPIDNKIDILTEAQKILTLDDYLPCNNPISIALTYIDELVKKGITKPIRLQDWNENIIRGMAAYNLTYDESVLYCIRHFFAFECTKLPLIPPVYSRELYKLGFVAPTRFGNSYKLANYKVNKFFNKK